ncbi:exodeoxyribonuclease III [Candidatus Fermentibacteria bacterium]|nr:MAG: exodeoxyribonuclease III [Candidatus Fermentibacteria bacterium]
MKIHGATWNVNSVRARLPVLLRWLEKEKPDILCIQEIKATKEQYPFDALGEAGYHSAVNGQVRWNGVAILSREPLQSVETDLYGYLPEQKRMISGVLKGVRFINVYVPNGGDVNNPRFQEKLEYLKVLRKYAMAFNEPVIVAGDFNVAPAPEDTHSPEEQDGTICYHPLEREQIAAFQKAGFADVFREHNPEGKAYSWWDYRAAGWRRNRGMRLDLVMADSKADILVTECVIDKEPRGWEKPSDHTPVVFTLQVTE